MSGNVVLVDGIHDLGGMQGIGAVASTPAASAFGHRWQAAARALLLVDGLYSVPDVEAHGTARRHEPAYSARFEAAELWRDGQPAVRAAAGLWDSYLEPS